MIVDITVPVLPESTPEGTLLAWKKQPGDAVGRDEVLTEVETDKVVLEVAAPLAGVIKEIIKDAGTVVAASEVLARIDTDGAVVVEAPADERAAPEAADASRPVLSPAVRKLIAEHDIDPGEIAGTGRGGRITKGDVLDFITARPPAPEPAAPLAAREMPPAAPAMPGQRAERREPMSRIRARIAERLVEAQQTAAILTTFNEIDMGPVMALRRRYRERFEAAHGARLGMMSFFAKAAVQALKRFPIVNASIEGNDVVYHDYYDIGVAVGSSRGLVVPVLRDVDRLSFAEIETRIAEFGRKAEDATLSIDDLTGGTFTITNGGIFGSLLSTPILNPPQSAILGLHKIEERPIADDGQVVIRPMMYVAMSYDHRLIDGRDAVRFLVAVKEAMEDPSRLLLEV